MRRGRNEGRGVVGRNEGRGLVGRNEGRGVVLRDEGRRGVAKNFHPRLQNLDLTLILLK